MLFFVKHLAKLLIWPVNHSAPSCTPTSRIYLAKKYLHMKTFLIALLLSAPFVTVVAQTATLTKAERKAAAK
jgi:hypothetical protein